MATKILSVLVLLLCLFSWQEVRAESGWGIDSFKSVIDINRDGSVLIRETIKINFSAPGKHGIYRQIPYRYRKDEQKALEISIEVLEVTQNGQKAPYLTTKEQNNTVIKIGDTDKTVSGEITYLIEYLVKGVLLAYDRYDEFYWNVTGDQWAVPIKETEAVVNLPEEGIIQAACYWGETFSRDRCQTIINTDNRQATFFIKQPLKEGWQMTIALGYVQGLVPIIKAQEVNYREGSFVGNFNFKKTAVAFLVSSLVSCAFVWYLFIRRRRKMARDADQSAELIESSRRGLSPISQKTIIAQYQPPYNLRPGELGVVMDQYADTLDISATIVDLAVRGYLTIIEEPKKWVLGSKDYVLRRTEKADTELLGYEKMLLNRIFQNDQSVQLSKLKNQFYQDLAGIKEVLYQHLTDKKYFFSHPNKERGFFIILAMTLFMAGAVTLFFLLASGYLFGIGIGIELAALLAILLAFRLPKRTALGEDAYKQALGYKLFVSGTEKYRQPFFERESIYTEVLPYAIVFKVTEELAKALGELGIEPAQPSWYVGAGSFNAVAFTQDMGRFASSVSSAIASSPSSSGSGGGGSSGGGFGGGGGGSW